jgi:MFS family permease
MYAVAAFLPAYLSRYHGLDLKQSNITAAVLLGGSGVAGILLGGWAADRVAPIRANGRLLVCAAAALVMAVFIALALLEAPGQVILFVLLMGAGCMAGYVYYAGVYATIQNLVPPRLRGTAMALYFLVMYMLGGSFGPVVTGKLSDHFARRAMAAAGVSTFNEHFRAAGLHSAMYGIAVCSGLLVVVLLCACRTLPGDMRASEAWMTAEEVEPAAGALK